MTKTREVFAVCDLEVDYAYHFMEYLNRKHNIPFVVRVFTSKETLLDFLKENTVALLLISEKTMCKEIEEKEIEQIIILSSGVGKKQYEEYPNIYKYQSSNQVLREALSCYGESHKNKRNYIQMEKRRMEIIGVYSPVGRTMKTTFALTLGQVLAKNQAVLYLNMEEYSGFEYLMQQNYDYTLSDLLYFLRQEEENISIRLNGMIQTLNNLDFVPPAMSPMDIQHTTLSQWIQLLQEIINYSNYEVIILDLGDGVMDLYQLLEQCTKIYVPIRTDMISQAKIAQFENLIRIWDCTKVLEKMKKIKLPYHRTVKAGVGYLDDLIWSELGDFVKELLRNEITGCEGWNESTTNNYETS